MSKSNATLVQLEDQIDRSFHPGGVAQDRAELLQQIQNYAGHVWQAASVLPARRIESAQKRRALTGLANATFVCGVHRSGTTLMQRLLDDHPQLFVLPAEGSWLTSFNPGYKSLPEAAFLCYFCSEWVTRLIDVNNLPHWKLGRTTVEASPYAEFVRRTLDWAIAFQSSPKFSFSPHSALVCALQEITGSSSRRGEMVSWVDKTPTNEFYTETLLAAYPSAKFIHIIRHPAAVLASHLHLQRQQSLGAKNFHDIQINICKSLDHARTNRHKYGDDRYLILRYEDLVQEPKTQMHLVAQFLEIEFNESLLTPSVLGKPVQGNSSYDSTGEGGIYTEAATRYKSGLSAGERSWLCAYSAAGAGRFGYTLNRGPAIKRISASIRRARYSLRNYVKRTLRR